MTGRRDALTAAAEMALAVERHCAERADSLVGTVGKFAVSGGGAINVIPGAVEFTVDLRSGDDAKRKAAVADVEAECRAIAARRNVEIAWEPFFELSAAPCDARLQAQWARSVAAHGVVPRYLPSGAGHDAMEFAAVAPIAMLFVRCGAGGISHNPRRNPRGGGCGDGHERVPALPRALRSAHAGGAGMNAPDALVRRVDANVDALLDEEIAFLRELVRLPTDTPPGDNAPAALRTAALLEAMGYAVERHPVPAAEVQAAGLTSVTNLVVRRRFGDGPVIALNAHGDVVPPGDGWTRPPYDGVIEDGRMYGRGVAVSKSDIATYAFALRALESAAREAGAALAGTVELHFTYDEEFGGELGPAWLLRRGLTRPDLALGPRASRMPSSPRTTAACSSR